MNVKIEEYKILNNKMFRVTNESGEPVRGVDRDDQVIAYFIDYNMLKNLVDKRGWKLIEKEQTG